MSESDNITPHSIASEPDPPPDAGAALADVAHAGVPPTEVPLAGMALTKVPPADVAHADVAHADVALADVSLADAALAGVPPTEVPLAGMALTEVPPTEVRPAGVPPAEQIAAPEFLSAPFQQAPVPQKGEAFWGWHDFFFFVFITVLAVGMAMLGGIGIQNWFHISEAHMNIVLVIAQFAAYGAAFTCLKIMFRAEYGEPLMASLHWLPAPIDPARLALIGLGQALTIGVAGKFMSVPEMDTPMNRLLADRSTALVIALLGVTIAPLAEELAFRGLLQPLLVRSVGVVPGILITSILFGMMHLAQYGAWQSVVLITLAGVGFGAMRQWSGSTRASAIMHAGYNSALFIAFFSQRGPHA